MGCIKITSFLDAIGILPQRPENWHNGCPKNGHADAARETPQGYALVLDKLDAKMVKKYMHAVLQSTKSRSTLSSIRSALNFAFNEERRQMPESMDKTIAHVLKKCKRVTQQEEGLELHQLLDAEKDLPLAYPMYVWMQKKMFTDSTPMAALYSVLTWNLVCKSSNTSRIQLSWMSWVNDALEIRFAGSDPSGNSPKPLFANPYEPHVCPILNLGVYLLCNPQLQNSLFLGSNPHHTFEQVFTALISSPASSAEFGKYGVSSHDIAMQSYWKGAAHLISSCSTDEKVYDSLCSRAGWEMEDNVPDFQFRQAHDRYVGRIVAGLPVQQPEFATLPPHFDEAKLNARLNEDGHDMTSIVEEIFPTLFATVRLRPVLKHALASVVYHHEFLLANLAPNHPLFSTALYTIEGVLEKLKLHVILSEESRYMTGTGIPPHVPQMAAYNRMKMREENWEARLVAVVKASIDKALLPVPSHSTLPNITASITKLIDAVNAIRQQQDEISNNQVAVAAAPAVSSSGNATVAPIDTSSQSNATDGSIPTPHSNATNTSATASQSNATNTSATASQSNATNTSATASQSNATNTSATASQSNATNTSATASQSNATNTSATASQSNATNTSATASQSNATNTSATASQSNAMDALMQHDHGDGEWYLVPVDWEFPTCNIVNGWRLWWLGDSVKRISPFRNLAGGYPSKLSKRFSDWKALFGKMEEYLRATGQIRGGSSPKTSEVASMFQIVSEQLIEKICPPKSKKRKNELMVSTVARKLRKIDIESFIAEQGVSNVETDE